MFSIRTRVRAVLAAAALLVGTTMVSAPAQAEDQLPVDCKVDVTTTMKSLGQTVVIPTGTFKGGIGLESMALTGDLNLPQAKKRFSLGSLPLADITFAMNQAAPDSGTVDLANMHVDAVASFNVRIVSVRPVWMPWLNLVGNTCRTERPVTSKMSGPISLDGANTFSGTYALGKFTGCGWGVTSIINWIVPGDGNTMKATFYP